MRQKKEIPSNYRCTKTLERIMGVIYDGKLIEIGYQRKIQI